MLNAAGGPAMVECVPNFSEGRRDEVIAAIEGAAGAQPAVALLDRHSDVDHNRTVLTFAGEAAAVYRAAMDAALVAIELIDLRHHQGVHPRMGAVDVLPFVPLWGSTPRTCAELARAFAADLTDRGGVPTYLYGEAARPGRPTSLSVLRDGGFEAMAARAALDPPPDFGGPGIHPSAGITAVGSRRALVALNVELDSGDIEVARQVARRVRESSGGLPAVQALGLRLPSRESVQVSMNLLDLDRTSPARALAEVLGLAATAGATVRAVELVGLLPEAALVGLQAFDLPGVPGPQDTIESRLAGLVA